MSGFKVVKEKRGVFVGRSSNSIDIDNQKKYRNTGSSLIFVLIVALCILAGPGGHAAVTVSFSGASQELQKEFIASTTAQWISTVKPGLFSGDYKIIVTAPNVVPPIVFPPLPTEGSAMDALMAVMVSNGMSYERYAGLQEIAGLYSKEALAGTCGGFPMVILKSTTTPIDLGHRACMQTYTNVMNVINNRWGFIYDPLGNMVTP